MRGLPGQIRTVVSQKTYLNKPSYFDVDIRLIASMALDTICITNSGGCENHLSDGYDATVSQGDISMKANYNFCSFQFFQKVRKMINNSVFILYIVMNYIVRWTRTCKILRTFLVSLYYTQVCFPGTKYVNLTVAESHFLLL